MAGWNIGPGQTFKSYHETIICTGFSFDWWSDGLAVRQTGQHSQEKTALVVIEMGAGDFHQNMQSCTTCKPIVSWFNEPTINCNDINQFLTLVSRPVNRAIALKTSVYKDYVEETSNFGKQQHTCFIDILLQQGELMDFSELIFMFKTFVFTLFVCYIIHTACNLNMDKHEGHEE